MNRRRLLQGLGAGTIVSLTPPVAWANSKPGRWLRLESPNFVMFSTASEDSSREELAALEGFQTLLTRIMPRKAPNPVKLPIYIARTDRDFELTAPHYRDSMVMGYYTASVEGTVAVSKSLRSAPRQRDMPRNVRADDARVIMFHEYTHHYVLANNRASYPPWYVEGIAEFLSTAEFNNKGVDIGKCTAGRAYSLVRGDWLPIEKLLKRPDRMTGEEASAFYAQAWLATHLMFVRPERAKGFDRYIQALQQGGDALAVFEAAFGITPKQFDEELRAYRDAPLQFWTMNDLKPIATGISIHRLTATVDDLLLPMVHLQRVPAPKDAADTIRRVKEQAIKYKGDAYAMRAGAWAEVWYGDLSAARTEIDAILALSAKEADTHHLSGLCDLRASYAKERDRDLLVRAQDAFGRAHGIDGSRASTMFRYVECGLGHTGQIDEDLLAVLVDAYHLAPQVSSIALTTAQALMTNERFEEAALVLRPLAADPHSGGMAEMAGVLLAAALAETRAQFAFAGAAMTPTDD